MRVRAALRGFVKWSGIALALLVVLVLLVIVSATRTAFGRERVRQVIVNVANRYLLGSLRVEALRFGPGCAIAIDSAVLRGPDEALLAAIGSANATCRFGSLVRGRLVITSLEVSHPQLIVRQSADGKWNWSQVIRPDTMPPPLVPDTVISTGPSRLIVSGPVRVTNGNVIVEDTGQRREVSAISIDASLVRAEVGGTSTYAELNGMSAGFSNPPIDLHRAGGSLSLVGDSLDIDLPYLSFSRSTAHVRGWIDWGRPGTPAVTARITVDTLAFGDVSWLARQIPTEGGGRFEVSVSGKGGGAPTDVVVSSATVSTTKSTVRGTLSLSFDSASLVIREALLDAAPLHTDLVRRLAADVLPAGMRGAINGRLVARGDGDHRLRIDTLNARFADEAAGGGISQVAAHGTLASGSNGGQSKTSLDLTVYRIDSGTMARVVPAFPPCGIVSGTARLDITSRQVLVRQSDLRCTDGDLVTRLTGGGTIHLGTSIGFDLALEAAPFAPYSVLRSIPALANVTSFDGPIEVHGSPSDLSVVASLRSPGGSVGLAARYRDTADGVAIRATARVRDADPRVLSGRGTVPSGKLNADVSVDLAGDSLAALQGTAELSGLTGTVGGVVVKPSLVRVSLTDARVVAESVLVETSAGVARASGALGLRRDVRDTMTVDATVSLAELAPLLRAAGVIDSVTTTKGPTALDSASGTVTARATVVGSVDSLDVAAEADGSQIALGGARASRVRVSANVAALPKALRGRATIHADSVFTGKTRFDSVSANADSDDGERWRVTLATASSDNPGARAAATLAVRSDTVDLMLDSLEVRVPGLALALQRPARFRRAGRGTLVLDSLELRGSRGALLRLSGVVRDTGAIVISLQLNDATIMLPPPAAEGDSVLTRLDARAMIEGTAATPRGSAWARMRFVDADSISLDSMVAAIEYLDGRGRILATAHGGKDGRRLFEARATVPAMLSLVPFRLDLPDEALSGDVSVDSLYLPDVTQLLPGVVATAGALQTHLTLGGTARHPRATGTAALTGVAATIPALGLDLHDLNTRLDVTEERLTIQHASVQAGKDPGGRAELSGVAGLVERERTDLQLKMTNMPVVRLPDVGELDVSTDLRLAGPGPNPTLSGTITVNRGVIKLPDMGRAGVAGVDDTAFVRLLDSLSTERVTPGGTSRLQQLAIGKVDVVMGPNVWIRSAEASIQLGGSVGLEQAAPQPESLRRRLVLRGTLVTQRGNYRLNVSGITRSFTLEQGSVLFRGEPEINPRLDINAIYVREGMDERQGSRRLPQVRAHLGGTLERPLLTLSSADAKLSQSELLSYLITGQSSIAVGDVRQGSVTNELVASATGALAQRVAGGLFDVVDVTATQTDDEASRGAAANVLASSRLGVGKQLSNRLFLKVDAGLCAFAGGSEATDLWHTFGVSVDYRFRRDVLGSISSAPSTNGATCTNQAAGRGTAITPRQWGIDFNRIWRF
ncbi:MAG TPA: translocation/assembly module TamB domain-containing protein [Gemmatimonadaceae bacterium]|nr:translocation/assembly module TamB domain-containing protein [Gemmatimonadaceae bacterium]